MKSFLAQIAEKYYAEYGSEVSQMAFVFPNKRAGIFFNKALSDVAQKPLFAPAILAINDLFFANSSLKQAKPITLKFVLYKTYKEVTQDEQSFDTFVSWCDPLLKDFNDIDKYMVDAKQVLQNVSDLEELKQSIDYLSEEQKAIIEHFWGKLCEKNNKNSILEGKFLELWEKLPQIYEQFKTKLREHNIGYDGMIFRDVAEHAQQNDDSLLFDYKCVVFVGFNALTQTEKALLEVCQKRGIGDFYFDYSSPEIQEKNNIAGHFIDENKNFKSQFNIEENIDLAKREFNLFSISSSVGQSKQVGQIVRNLKNGSNIGTNTAVILSNEALLFPTLQALPNDVSLNITMGYPLVATPLVALIEQIATMQKNLLKNKTEKSFYHKFVESIVLHPYLVDYEQQNDSVEHNFTLQQLYDDIIRTKKILVAPSYFLDSKKTTAADELIKAIFVVVENSDDFIAYLRNIVQILSNHSFDENRIDYRYCQAVLEALNLIEKCQDEYDEKISNIGTIYKLFRQLISDEKAAFESDIVEGLQVMGTLEARGIDFENVIITSFNEGTFPQSNINSPSFIPYNIRRAYGLPTYEYHDAIFAYNFYRLIYRAKRIYFIYDNRTDGLNRSEISRYALQLKHILGANIGEPTVIDNKIAIETHSVCIEKNAEILELMQKFQSQPKDGEKRANLSASAINEFNSCSLNFYLSRILGMREEKQLDDSADNSMLGDIFHYAMESIYKPFKKSGQEVTKEFIDELLNSKIKIEELITDAFQQKIFNSPDINGNYMLLAQVVENYIRKMLEYDRDYNAPFKIIGTEYELSCQYEFADGHKINVHGYIDRIHEKDGIIHIVDYKTGGKTLKFSDIEDLFNADKDLGHICQVFFYSLLYKQETKTTKKIVPHIYSLRHLDNNTIKHDKDAIDNFENYEKEFANVLNENIKGIFDPQKPFEQTENENHCKFCSFKLLCNRKTKENF